MFVMKTWNLPEAKAHLAELIQACVEEPQLVCEQDIPRAVMIDVTLFNALTDRQLRQQRPTIAQLLDELQEIKAVEPDDIEIPERQDRDDVMAEVFNEIPL
jgi:hypothetical protein